MDILVWTASKGGKDRIDTYKVMVESVKQAYPRARFITSASFGPDPGQIEDVSYNIVGRRLCQFEHLEKINEMCRDMDPDTQILFMDDDDVMLEKPSVDTGIVVGLQYVPAFDGGELVQDVEAMRSCLDQCMDMTDFSGFMAPLSLIRIYFREKKRPRIVKDLEDTRFMEWLEGKNASIPSKPFIFHRLHPPGQGQDWLPNLYNEMIDMMSGQMDHI